MNRRTLVAVAVGIGVVGLFDPCSGWSVAPGTNLSGADLSGCDLADADPRNATLENVALSDAELVGAELTDATWVDGSTCTTPDCDGRAY